MIDSCICPARATAQNINFTLIRLYPVYNSMFDYLCAVVYNLYNSTHSTYELACTHCTIVYSPPVPQWYSVLKKHNSNKCTAAHQNTCCILWASGDAQTLVEFPSPADIHRCSSAVFKITNRDEDTAAHRDKCDTVGFRQRTNPHSCFRRAAVKVVLERQGLCLQQHNLSIQ